MKKINTPLDSKKLQSLKAGEEVFLSGTLYTARDQAHKRMVDNIGRGGESPFDFKGAVVYYCGPTRTPKGKAIGSCGPTTSGRMDVFTPALLAKGLKAMIGKGARSPEVKKAIKKYKGIYFVTYAGCAAFLAGRVSAARAIAYRDLGPEAVMELEVKDFPLIVAVDSRGRSIYGQD